MNDTHLGSSFDSFLEEEGILEEVQVGAIKRTLNHGVGKALRAMREQAGFSLAELGQRLGRDTRDLQAREDGSCAPSFAEVQQWALCCGYSLTLERA